MIQLLLVSAATVVACEIILRCSLPRHLSALSGYSRKAATVVRSARISDHWKERVLPAYAGRIMRASLGLLFWIVVVALPILAAAALAEGSLSAGAAWLMRPVPLAVMLAVAVIWIWGRRRLAG